MRIDFERHLLTGLSIGLTHQSTDLGEQIFTLDLLVLRFIVGLVPESAQSAEVSKRWRGSSAPLPFTRSKTHLPLVAHS
jgi:hypothetical protein